MLWDNKRPKSVADFTRANVLPSGAIHKKAPTLKLDSKQGLNTNEVEF